MTSITVFSRSCCALLTFFLLLQAPAYADTDQEQQSTTYRQLEIFSNVLSILQQNYVDEIDTKEALNGAIKGLLLSLDPHSSYLPPEDFRELQEETSGSFSGIGIEVTIKNELLTIVSPIADTPADRAGLQANDVILEIDGEKTKNMGSFEAIKKLRGPTGSKVTLAVHRQEWEEAKTFTLTRELISIQSVKSEFLAPGFGYIRITNFQSHTAGDFKVKLNELNDEQKVKGLIVDLRNNPGGLLDQAVAVADVFLSSGNIVYTRGRRADQDNTYTAHSQPNDVRMPLVVLVNEGSASASEIVAGAVQAQKRGIIVGMRTFGKGSVQTVIPLPDGAGLRMTTATYFTPDNRSIQARGIVPDVEVPLAPCIEQPDQNSHKILKEADLDGHLPANISPTEGGDETPPPALSPKLAEDNQLRTAYNILKSIDLYATFGKKQ
ncbi:S41 family peptidase [Desulforhopalus singaporensis]|uniref:Carboxyl-terminal processing protease n=1 Tax=Desulforhopalus singaporensis TaxID=91360 RepID=A0A1H0QNZ6_9BACT|nr:S41 family peptidase [Desulforhopalus singaporensis]SDP18388.1 carboxyl-terminal processing protease [Desulforhopalus singaporensis]